jgi:hypothetical protein
VRAIFIKKRKELERLRSSNNRIAFLSLLTIGLCLLGLGIVLSHRQNLLSDFLVNLSAGFISAAIFSIVIERGFGGTQKTLEDTQLKLDAFQTRKLLQERVDAIGLELVKLVRVNEHLSKEIEGKNPSERIELLTIAINVSQEVQERASAILWFVAQSEAIMLEEDRETYLNRELYSPEDVEKRARANSRLLRENDKLRKKVSVAWDQLERMIEFRDILIKEHQIEENALS